MSESDTTTSAASGAGTDQPTQEIRLPRVDAGPTTVVPPVGPPPFDPPLDMAAPDDEWPARGPRKGIRMSIPTVALLALLVAAGGIWGGAALQRSQGSSSSASSLSSLASLFRGARSGTGSGAGGLAGGAFAPAAAGTVTEVSGSTVYVTNSSGTLVKVTVSPSTTITRTATSSLGGLQVGDTVVVEGTKQSDGSVSATSVAATAAGVSSGGGFFGG